MSLAEPPVQELDGVSYRFDHRWAKLPDEISLGNTHAVQEDRDGAIHVAHTGGAKSACRDSILVFSPEGELIRTWGEAFEGSAHGLEFVQERGTEFAYVTDLKRGLFKTTLDGEIVWHYEKPDFYRVRFGLRWTPSNVAIAPDGTVFLADGYGAGFIIVLDRDGNELGIIGGPGLEDHHLVHPHGLTIDTRLEEPLLLVADNRINRFHYLKLSGEHVRFEHEESQVLVAPRHFRLHGEKLLMPDLGGRVALFDGNNQLLGYIGDAGIPMKELFPLRENPRDTFPDGKFIHPHDALFASDGSLYVVEWVEDGRITRLTPEAR